MVIHCLSNTRVRQIQTISEDRPVRDLLRQRLLLVQRRAELYGRLSRLLLREGIIDASRYQVKELSEEELAQYFTHPLLQLSARQELARITLYSEQITQLEQAILERAQEQAAFERLQQVYGIGRVLALTILYEVGEVSRFENMRHFCSYCRVVPGVAQSGSVTKRGRGSKQGNHYLKWATLAGCGARREVLPAGAPLVRAARQPKTWTD